MWLKEKARLEILEIQTAKCHINLLIAKTLSFISCDVFSVTTLARTFYGRLANRPFSRKV